MAQVKFEDIAEFVAAVRRCRQENIMPETTLAKDLGFDGDEAEALFEEFARRFSVDLSGIRWRRYFAPESWMLNPFVILWPPSWREIREKKLPVRIADLLSAANSGRWNFPYEKA